MLDTLFYCGHFCVLYMNPCHFHTGVMAIKPDNETYAAMRKQLATTGYVWGLLRAGQLFTKQTKPTNCYAA